MMEFFTERISEKEFAAQVKEAVLKFAPMRGEATIVMLCSKLGSFDDPIHPQEGRTGFSPVFIYGPEHTKGAEENIGEWVDHIANKHFMLPALLVDYFVAKMAEEELEGLLSNPEKSPDENLAKALKKAKAEIKQ